MTSALYKSTSEKGKDWPQILAIIAVGLGPFTNGLLFVWSSPFTLVITRDKENYNITEEEASYFIILQPVGMLIGSLCVFKLLEVLGRKKAVMFLALPHLIAWLIVIFARSKWDFYAARLVSGFGDTCMFCSVPPYVGEISTPSVRGLWGNTPTFLLYAGQFMITVLGSYLDVRTTAYICIGVPILFFLLVSTLPESPYQLIKDGKHAEARKSIAYLRKKSDVEEDFIQMKADVERQISESANWKDLFTIISNRRALRAGVFLRFSQQLSGIAVFASYNQPIFEKAGSSLSPQLSSIIFLGMIWTLNLFCSAVVERFGRKLSYFYSILVCGILTSGLAIYFFLDQTKLIDVSNANWLPLAGMVAWTVSYSFGLGVVPTLMLGELFSASIKSKGLSVLTASFALSVFLTTYMFNQLTAYFGLYTPFLFFGLCSALSAMLTLKWVPETKGKTLEEIQQALKS